MSIDDQIKETPRKHRAAVENFKYIGLVFTHLRTIFFSDLMQMRQKQYFAVK